MPAPPERKIHIIDDDSQTIQVLEFVLARNGYHVSGSHSGEQALSTLKSYTPDLIMLDIFMPGMDGYEVCAKIKEDAQLKDVPVIFITAAGQTQELVRGFEAGAVDFISKPFNKAELLARVNTHIELKRSKDTITNKNLELQTEIENRKQAEEKFRALSETAFEAVVFVHNNIIIEANKAASRLFGLNKNNTKNKNIFYLTNEKTALGSILNKKEKEGPWEINFIDHKQQSFHGLLQKQEIRYKGKTVNVLAIRDITRQKEIDKEILNAVLETEDKERKRFSRDLHDGLGAILSTLKIYLTLIQKENKTPDEKKMLIAEMKETINNAIESARTIANNIMPGILMDLGLIKALISFIDALNKTGVIHIEFKEPDNLPRLDTKTETHLYKIILELINNTIKHAKANHIDLNIYKKNKKLIIDFKDNGIGFDFDTAYHQKSESQGLKNILSRVNFLEGEASFNTGKGKNTHFHLELDL